MRLLILFILFFSFIIPALLGRLLGRLGAANYTIILMLSVLCVCIFSLYEIIFNNIIVTYSL